MRHDHDPLAALRRAMRSRSAAMLGVILLAACDSEKPQEGAAVSTSFQAPSGERSLALSPAASAEPKSAADRPPPEGGLGAACTTLCSQTAALGCSNHSACVPACQRSFDLPFCPAELTAFLTCAMKTDLASWECSDQGTPALEDGHCEREQEAVVGCVTKAGAK